MIYRIKQTQKLCPNCSIHESNHRSISASSSASRSSASGQHRRIIIPLKKKVIQHNQNISQTLTLLQEQVNKLKQQNVVKDHKIQQLQQQLNIQYDLPNRCGFISPKKAQHNISSHQSSIYHTKRQSPVYQNEQFGEFTQKQGPRGGHNNFKFINKDKTKTYFNGNHKHDKYSADIKYQQNNIGSPATLNMTDRNTNRNNNSSNHNHNQTRSRVKKSGSPSKALNQIQARIKTMNENKNQKIELLAVQLEHYQSALYETQQRLTDEASQNQWMLRFCMSFIKMVTQIAAIQGHQVTDPMWPIRKNTKNSWKYLKQFVHQVIS